jgi:hypothetical protein
VSEAHAKFKFLKQNGLYEHLGRGEYLFKGVAVAVEGTPKPGMHFRVFDTSHPVDFAIRSVTTLEDGTLALEVISAARLHEGFFDGAVIDTAGMTRGVHFYWE